MTHESRLFTRIELEPCGFVGSIRRKHGQHFIEGRYVIPFGSRRTVRRSLKAALRHARRYGA